MVVSSICLIPLFCRVLLITFTELAKTFDKKSVNVLEFVWRILSVPSGWVPHRRTVSFEGCVAEPFEKIRAISTGVEICSFYS